MTDIERPSIVPAEPGEFRLSHSPSHLLRRAQQFIADRFADEEVTLRQTVVLAAVAERGTCSQSDLVRATGVDRSTMAEMIARMEKKGLVNRTKAATDGRAKAVSLTPAGRQRLTSALPAIQEMDDALLELLPRNKRKPFRDTLGIIVKAASPPIPEADEDDSMDRRKKSKSSARSGDKTKKKKKKKDKKKK